MTSSRRMALDDVIPTFPTPSGRRAASWSLDDRLISVNGRAYDAESTTTEFLTWWNDEAGPLT